MFVTVLSAKGRLIVLFKASQQTFIISRIRLQTFDVFLPWNISPSHGIYINSPWSTTITRCITIFKKGNPIKSVHGDMTVCRSACFSLSTQLTLKPLDLESVIGFLCHRVVLWGQASGIRRLLLLFTVHTYRTRILICAGKYDLSMMPVTIWTEIAVFNLSSVGVHYRLPLEILQESGLRLIGFTLQKCRRMYNSLQVV